MTERPASAGLLPRSGIGRGVLFAVLWTVVALIFAAPSLRGDNWSWVVAYSPSTMLA